MPDTTDLRLLTRWCQEHGVKSIGHFLEHGNGYLHERGGLYHLAGGGHASRFDWATEILKYDP